MVSTSSTARAAVVAAVVVTGFALRPAVTSLGVVLDAVRADLGMSATAAGVVSALPVLCFATFGAGAPALARRAGWEATLALGTLAITVGLAVRAAGTAIATFVAGTVLALAGIALAGVLLPALVKARFPQRVGLMTGLFSLSTILGVAVPAVATRPVAAWLGGGWHTGLGVWAVLAAPAAVLWAALIRRGTPGRRSGPADHRTARSSTGATPLRRHRTAVALLLFFGLQSLGAFALMSWLPSVLGESGVDPQEAGTLLAVTGFVGLPLALAGPVLAARIGSPSRLVVGIGLAVAAGWAGLLLAPGGAPWVWAVLLAAGHGAYPLAVTLVALRARTEAGALRLSRFVQTGGYLIAALGPLAMGGLRDLTGSWTLPLALVLATVVLQILSGVAAARGPAVDEGRATPDRVLSGAGTAS